MNALADADEHTLRISIDTKATVNVGEYSRGGRSRGVEAVKALDHDMYIKEKLVPGGILEPVSGRSFLFFGTNHKTSDFMVDGLLLWWQERKQELPGLRQLVINLDNGPECNGRRTQFLLRMIEFADLTGLSVRTGLLPALSQQVQRHRALLGRAGKIMERLFAQHRGYGHQSSWQFLLERHAHHGTPGRCHLRKGSQTLRQRENRLGATTGAIHRVELVGHKHPS